MHANCLPSASVVIRMNGRNLEEYETEAGRPDDGMTARCFVEAVDGAEFTVAMTLERGFAHIVDELTMWMHLDGKQTAGVYISLHDLPQRSVNAEIKETYENWRGTHIARAFRFAAHQTTEEQPGKSFGKDALAEFGEVKIVLTRCRKGKKRSLFGGHYFEATGRDGVPEKALKGRSISQHAELGPAKTTHAQYTTDATYPYGTRPIATYIFKYRSRGDLVNEGIIERNPSPIPLEDRDPDTLTPVELREQNRLLRARQQATNHKKSEVKQEGRKRKRQRSVTVGREQHDDTNDVNEGDVTFTGEFHRRKVPRPEDIIDLTDG